jgi:hypothetical protein
MALAQAAEYDYVCSGNAQTGMFTIARVMLVVHRKLLMIADCPKSVAAPLCIR